MSGYDETRLAALLRALPPAPQAWVQAAKDLPRARREFDEIVARAEADAGFRQALLADLERALADSGFDPGPVFVEELRARLSAE